MPSFGSNSGNSGSKAGMPTNIKPKASAPASAGTMKAMDTIVQEVIRGEWGNGEERKQRLEAAGYSYEVVQGKVNRELSSIKSLDEVAAEVIRGNWGNGAERLCSRAFDVEAKDGMAVLPGVVSRKKQVIPAMMNTLAKLETEE